MTAFDRSANAIVVSRMFSTPVTVAATVPPPNPTAVADRPATPGARPLTVAVIVDAPCGTTTCGVSTCTTASASLVSDTVTPPAGATTGAIDTGTVCVWPRTMATADGKPMVFAVTVTGSAASTYPGAVTVIVAPPAATPVSVACASPAEPKTWTLGVSTRTIDGESDAIVN